MSGKPPSRANSPSELPLFAWRPARKRRPRPSRRHLVAAAMLGLSLATLLMTAVRPPAPRLVWNASASAPPGLYSVRPGAPVRVGDMVVAWLPDGARRLADRRRYLPASVPAVKRVAAAAGARVCAWGRTVTIDGRRAASRLTRDRRGRPLPWWRGCRTLRQGDIFLLMAESRESFDGRYFGVSRRADIVGAARLVWPAKAESAR